MPIRTPRGRAAAYRALWQWPLRSPARLALVVVAAIVVAVVASTALASVAPPVPGPATGPTGRPASASARPGAAPAPTRAPTATALPPVSDLVPTALPPADADPAALAVAARWTAAWVRPPDGTTAARWLEGLRPLTTEEYLGLLATVDPGNIPATRVTGEPRVVRAATSSVRAEVPTDAVTLVVLVVRTELGEWRVSGYDEV